MKPITSFFKPANAAAGAVAPAASAVRKTKLSTTAKAAIVEAAGEPAAKRAKVATSSKVTLASESGMGATDG